MLNFSEVFVSEIFQISIVSELHCEKFPPNRVSKHTKLIKYLNIFKKLKKMSDQEDVMSFENIDDDLAEDLDSGEDEGEFITPSKVRI